MIQAPKRRKNPPLPGSYRPQIREPFEVIRTHVKWAAILIAREHKGQEEGTEQTWTCDCRCCDWTRKEITL